MNAWIYGVGTTRFGRQSDRLPAELGWEAVAEALADADVSSSRCGVCRDGVRDARRRAARVVGRRAHRDPDRHRRERVRERDDGAGRGRARDPLGPLPARAGAGGRAPDGSFKGPISSDPTDVDQATGLLFPGLYAMSASRYMYEHGASRFGPRRGGREELAPRLDEPARAAPDRIDARAGAGVADDRRAADALPVHRALRRGRGRGARAGATLGARRAVRGVALGSGRAWDHESTGTWGAGLVRDIATQAYAQAGIEPGDADVLEVHDAFTIGEIVTLESMGLAQEGEAPAAIAAGAFQHRRRDAGQPVRRPARARASARRHRPRAVRGAGLAAARRGGSAAGLGPADRRAGNDGRRGRRARRQRVRRRRAGENLTSRD